MRLVGKLPFAVWHSRFFGKLRNGGIFRARSCHIPLTDSGPPGSQSPGSVRTAWASTQEKHCAGTDDQAGQGGPEMARARLLLMFEGPGLLVFVVFEMG